MIQHIWNVLSKLSYIDLSQLTRFYNHNHECTYWSKSLTTKRMKNISLCEKHTNVYFHIKELHILHIGRKLNVSDISKKEIHDGDHFISLRITFMHTRPRILWPTYRCQSGECWTDYSNYLSLTLEYPWYGFQRLRITSSPRYWTLNQSSWS